MFLSKLELGLEHLYGFEQASARAQAFFVLSSKLKLKLETFFCACNPLARTLGFFGFDILGKYPNIYWNLGFHWIPLGIKILIYNIKTKQKVSLTPQA